MPPPQDIVLRVNLHSAQVFPGGLYITMVTSSHYDLTAGILNSDREVLIVPGRRSDITEGGGFCPNGGGGGEFPR